MATRIVPVCLQMQLKKIYSAALCETSLNLRARVLKGISYSKSYFADSGDWRGSGIP